MEHIVKDFWETETDLLHAKPDEVSENGPLFTAEYHLAQIIKNIAWRRGQSGELVPAWVAWGFIIDTPYAANPPEAPGNFSHDNLTGLYILEKILYINTKLPFILVNGKISAPHPRDWFGFYPLMAMPWWSYPLLPLIYLSFALITMQGIFGPNESTSGRCLIWSRLHALKYLTGHYMLANFLISWCNMVMKLKGISWKQQFSLYFPYKNHPINNLMRALYETK
jgi:hypothetical protein